MRRRKVSSSFSVTTIHDGNDGYNNAVVTIYQRMASAPSVPSSSLIYSFMTGLLTPAGSLSGWSLSIPDVDGNPCWVTQASVRSQDSSVTIGSADWGTVRKLVEDGKNCIRLDLSNEHEDFLYDDAGNNRSGSASSQARLYDGISEVDASDVNWSIDATKSSGVLIDASSSDFSTKGTSVSSAGLLTVKALTAAVAKVTVKAEYPKSSGRCYYAEFTANKTSQDKYDLVIKPNSIAYNPISYTTQTIAVSAKRLDLSGTPSTASISTTSGSGMLRLFRSYVNNNGTLTSAEQLTSLSQSIDSTTANSYAGVYFELRKYANASGNNSSSYSVADYETVPITKAQNGAHGDTPITAYRWYKSGLTPTKPTDVSDDMPDAVDYLNDNTNAQPTTAWSNTAPNRPADGWHLWIVQSTKHTAANGNVTRDAWSDPVRISGDKGSPGEDAAGREWIYKLSSSSVPSIPSTSNNTDGYVPSGWTNHPTGIDATNIYEYACYRDKAAGTGTRTWSGWKGKTGGASGDKPILWSHWGRNGMDGDGTEYVFIRTKTNVKPTILDTGNPDSAYIYDNAKYLDSNGGLDNEDEFLPIASVSSGTIEANNVASGNNGNGVSGGTTGKFGECTDDPKGISEEWPYEWAIKRTKAEPDANGVRSWNVFAGEMSLWARWANDGTSPWVADLDNEMDSVSCDDTGHPVSEQTVRTVLSLFHGAAGKTFDTPTVQRNGTAVEYDVNANGVTVQLSRTTLQIVYQTSAQISGKDDYTITLTATDDNTVTRTLHFIVNGVIGDVYNLLPSANQLNIASGQATASLACGYKKNVNGTITEYPNETGIIDTKYSIFFRRRLKSTGAFETYYILYSGTGTYHGNARALLSSLNVSVYDAVEFYLCTSTSSSARSIDGKYVYYATSLTNVIDRETVPVVSDGAQGRPASPIYRLKVTPDEASFLRLQNNTLSPSSIDITVGYTKTDTSGTVTGEYNSSGIPNSGGIGIYYRVIKSDGTPLGTYSHSDPAQPLGWDYLNHNQTSNPNTISGVTDAPYNSSPGVMHIPSSTNCIAVEFCLSKVGAQTIANSDILDIVTVYIKKGVEPTAIYSLLCQPDNISFRSDAVGVFSGSKIVACLIKKAIGNAIPETITSGTDGMYLYCRKLGLPSNTWQEYTNGNRTVSSSEAIDASYPVTGIEFCLSTEANRLNVTDSSIVVSKTVAVTCDGRRGAVGAMGRMFYPYGTWDERTTYRRTDEWTPMVFYNDGTYNNIIKTKGHYYYLDVASDQGTEPSDAADSPWKKCNDFAVVIAQGIFAEYAKLGKGVFCGDYFFSMNGKIGDTEYLAGATVGTSGMPAYTRFVGDPSVLNGYANRSALSGPVQLDRAVLLTVRVVEGVTINISFKGKTATSGTYGYFAICKGSTIKAYTSSNYLWYQRRGSSLSFTATETGDYTIEYYGSTAATSATFYVFYELTGYFQPNWWVDLLTGKMSAAQGNFVVDGAGDVKVNGAMMSHKVKLQTKLSKYITFPDHAAYEDDYWDSNGDVYLYEPESDGLPVRIYSDPDAIYYGLRSCKLKYDQVYIGVVAETGKRGRVIIYLPPPHLFIGQRITITNNTLNFPSGSNISGVFLQMDYMLYSRTDYSEGICLTGQDAYFEDDEETGEHDSNGKNGKPYICYVPERGGADPIPACGIWMGEVSESQLLFFTALVDEMNIEDYEWIELTSMRGYYAEKYEGTAYWESTMKYNAYWMLTRWQKKSS